MTRDNLDKLGLFLLLLAALFVFSDILFGQVEGAMGTLPLPRIVGMQGHPALRPPPLTVDVIPKITDTGRKTFRVRIRIEPNDDNREYAYFASCGSEEKSSIRKIDFVTLTLYEELTVIDNCLFQVCISRIGNKHALCAKQEVVNGQSQTRDPPLSDLPQANESLCRDPLYR